MQLLGQVDALFGVRQGNEAGGTHQADSGLRKISWDVRGIVP